MTTPDGRARPSSQSLIQYLQRQARETLPNVLGRRALVLLVLPRRPLVLACLLAACASEPHDVASDVATRTWTVGDSALVTIGGASGDPAAELERVGDVLRLGDGRIVVVNGSAELRFYTADGRLAATQGREGRGPGEYVSLRGIARLPGDTIAAFDGIARQLSIIDPQGRFVRSQAIPAVGFRMVGLLSDGSVVVGPRARQWTPDGAETEPSTYLFDRVPRDGDAVVTLASIPGPSHFVVQFSDGGRGQMDLPFAPEPRAATAGALLYVTAAAGYAIDAYAADGRHVRTITHPRPPAPVAEEDLERHRVARLAELQPWPEQQRRFTTAFARMPKPRRFPAIGDLVAGDGGELWVQDYPRAPEAPARWTAFDSTGAVLASATMPAGLRVLRIGRDYVLGVERDALDVERVVLLPLRRR